jgi:hypothetical protein
MLPGLARSESFRIMLFSIPRRKAGGWNGFNEFAPANPSDNEPK